MEQVWASSHRVGYLFQRGTKVHLIKSLARIGGFLLVPFKCDAPFSSRNSQTNGTPYALGGTVQVGHVPSYCNRCGWRYFP